MFLASSLWTRHSDHGCGRLRRSRIEGYLPRMVPRALEWTGALLQQKKWADVRRLAVGLGITRTRPWRRSDILARVSHYKRK